MSKRKTRQQQMAAKALAARKKRTLVVLTAVLLCLSLSGGILAQWKTIHLSTGTNAMLAPAAAPTPLPPPSSPTKEYIYAGGRLIATEEPTSNSSTGNTPPNAVTDFSSSQNPNGAWSYGYKTLSGSTLNLYSTNSNYFGAGLETWRANASYCCPMVTRNHTASTLTYSSAPSITQPTDLLNLLPGPNGERSVLRWTAPAAGSYLIAGRFQGLDSVGTTTDVTILHNSASVFTGNVSGYGNQVPFSVTITAGAGDTVDFQVGYGSNNSYSYDSTGLAATITAQTGKVNYALAANGGVATASSSYAGNTPNYVNDGSRRAVNGTLWIDNTVNAFPDWVEVDFNSTRTIDEIDLITQQDEYQNPVEPTLTQTFTAYGTTAFEVQYWNGSAWADVPGVEMPGVNAPANNKVWRQFTFSPITTDKVRVLIHNGADGIVSRVVELEAYGVAAITPPTGKVNYALASNGGVATASSFYAGYLPSYVNDGSRRAVNGAIWIDNTVNAFPDWVEVDFNSTRTIDEIDLITQQDDYQNPIEPSLEQTFSLYGNTAFEVQYWNGSTWATIPLGSVTGNNKVWRQFTFSPITTSRVRVLVNNCADGIVSRVVELEAYGAATTRTNVALSTAGAEATASSSYTGYTPNHVNDGSRRAVNGAIWIDNTVNAFPDSVEIDFHTNRTIDEIEVIMQQDDYQNPIEPFFEQTFSLYGNTAFEVQYWNGSAWVTIPLGSVTGNSRVWRQFTFPAVTTSKIRLVVNDGQDHIVSRVVELEAWGN